MSSYRFLQDHYIGQAYYPAGTVQSTADVGGVLPVNWKPSGNVEPLDASAVTAFYNAGPQVPGLVRQNWSDIAVFPPVTRWVAATVGLNTSWTLSGLGVGLPPISN